MNWRNQGCDGDQHMWRSKEVRKSPRIKAVAKPDEKGRFNGHEESFSRNSPSHWTQEKIYCHNETHDVDYRDYIQTRKLLNASGAPWSNEQIQKDKSNSIAGLQGERKLQRKEEGFLSASGINNLIQFKNIVKDIDWFEDALCQRIDWAWNHLYSNDKEQQAGFHKNESCNESAGLGRGQWLESQAR